MGSDPGQGSDPNPFWLQEMLHSQRIIQHILPKSIQMIIDKFLYRMYTIIHVIMFSYIDRISEL